MRIDVAGANQAAYQAGVAVSASTAGSTPAPRGSVESSAGTAASPPTQNSPNQNTDSVSISAAGSAMAAKSAVGGGVGARNVSNAGSSAQTGAQGNSKLEELRKRLQEEVSSASKDNQMPGYRKPNVIDYKMDDNSLIVRIMDATSDKVIKEIPPEATRRIKQYMTELIQQSTEKTNTSASEAVSTAADATQK